MARTKQAHGLAGTKNGTSSISSFTSHTSDVDLCTTGAGLSAQRPSPIERTAQGLPERQCRGHSPQANATSSTRRFVSIGLFRSRGKHVEGLEPWICIQTTRIRMRDKHQSS